MTNNQETDGDDDVKGKALKEACEKVMERHFAGIDADEKKSLAESIEADWRNGLVSLRGDLGSKVQSIVRFIKTNVSGEIGAIITELQIQNHWRPSDGNEKLEIVLGMHRGLYVEQRILRQAIFALTMEPDSSPFELSWTHHMFLLGQLEILDGDPCDGRQPLIEFYQEAFDVIALNWGEVTGMLL